ncbi:MAG: BatD family protein [Proteobacteria bacterium]|nr:BatD family protein [Pseudomonadota bacterium]
MSWLLRVLVLCFVSSPAWAASVSLVVGASEFAAGQTTTVEVQVVDGKPLAVPQITVPDGFEIEYLHPSNMTIRSGGRLVRVVRYQYELTATVEGSFTIGPATVELASGEDLVSLTRSVGILAEGDMLNQPFDAEISYTPSEAWEGEVVVFRYRLRSRVRPARTRWHPFDFEGLVAPRDGDRPRREYSIEDATGSIWMDETWIPLIVTGTGDLSMESTVLNLFLPTDERRDPLGLFGRTRAEVVMAGPAPLVGKALPPAPDDFSGLVGDFSLEGGFDTTALSVGESATWTLSLRGQGALDGFVVPKPEADGLRVYDGATATSAAMRDGTYTSAARYELSVVPTRAGKVQVPKLELVVFSPSRGDYITLETPGRTLTVSPGSGTAVDVESFAPDAIPDEPVEVLPADIRGPKSFGLARSIWLGPLLPWALLAAGLPGLLALFAGGLEAAQAARERRRKPLEAVVDPLARLRHLPEEREARLTELDAAFRECLALREGVAVGGLDRSAAVANLPDGLREKVVDATRALDRARFADGPEDDLVERVITLVDAVGDAA